MGNTISSGLMPKIIGTARKALSEEMSFLKNVNHNFSDASGTVGQTVEIGIPARLSASTVSPAAYAPVGDALTINSAKLTLGGIVGTKFSLHNSDVQNYNLTSTGVQQIKEAVRGLAYDINAKLWANYYQIPYHVGTAGTGVFASNTDTLADLDGVLLNNLVPRGNRNGIFSVKDITALKKTDDVKKAYAYGSADVIQRGVIPPVQGFNIDPDQQVPIHTTGTITTGLTVKSGTTPVEGDTTLVCTTAASTGACALKQGDIVTIDSKNYSLQVDATQASAASDVTLNLDRGLESAPDAGDAVTIATGHGTSYVNIGGDFTGASLVLRLPETNINGTPVMGDHQVITDEKSGASFLFSTYGQFHQVTYAITAIAGTAITDPRRLSRIYSYAS